MTTEEIAAKVAELEGKIQVLTNARNAARAEGLALNAERDKLTQQVALEKLREKHPELTINPA